MQTSEELRIFHQINQRGKNKNWKESDKFLDLMESPFMGSIESFQMEGSECSYQIETKAGVKALEAELEFLGAAFSEAIRAQEEEVEQVIQECCTIDLFQKRENEMEMRAFNKEEDEAKGLALTRERRRKRAEDHFLSIRVGLEGLMSEVVVEYDKAMREHQTSLDELQEKWAEGEKSLTEVGGKLREVNIVYDEMTRAKKLQEILKNIARADNFRRERAAKTIQDAWRAWKKAKEQRRRRKGKKRGGKRAGKESTPSSTDSTNFIKNIFK